MECFYLPNLEAPNLILDGDQLRHAVKALRKRVGDVISVTDGAGNIYDCEITHIDRREAALAITDRRILPPPDYGVVVAMALTKNIKRIEWAIEKMTEMGIQKFVPLKLKRSERDTMNRTRIQKIMVSAMKQSQQVYLPELSEVVAISDFFAEHSEDTTRFIAHKSESSVAVRDNYTKGSDVVILIGPEGDFTKEELEAAREAGFMQIGLGNTRLRTETAAVTAVAYIHALNS